MITLTDFISREKARLWSGKHLQDVTFQLNRFCNFNNYGDRSLDSFVAHDIHEFQEHLIGNGLAKSTANRYNAAISKIFDHAVKGEVINHAPRFNWFKEKGNRIRYFTSSEIKQIEEFFGNHKHSWMKQMFIIGINTGMRLGEITQIGDTAHVETDAEGSVWLYLPQTKNGDERYVPLNKPAQKAIQELGGRVLDHYSHRKFYNAWDDCRYAVAKNDESFVFHVCRHTAASRLANDLGTQTILIGALLGHRSEQTTRKYVHAKPSTLQDIAKQLGKVA